MRRYHSWLMSTMDYPLNLADQLSAHLRSLRKARGITQKDLAKLLGVAQSRIAAIEANPGAVSMNQLFDVLRALGATLVLRDMKASSHLVYGQPPSTRFGTPTATQSAVMEVSPTQYGPTGNVKPSTDDGADW